MHSSLVDSFRGFPLSFLSISISAISPNLFPFVFVRFSQAVGKLLVFSKLTFIKKSFCQQWFVYNIVKVTARRRGYSTPFWDSTIWESGTYAWQRRIAGSGKEERGLGARIAQLWELHQFVKLKLTLVRLSYSPTDGPILERSSPFAGLLLRRLNLWRTKRKW